MANDNDNSNVPLIFTFTCSHAYTDEVNDIQYILWLI